MTAAKGRRRPALASSAMPGTSRATASSSATPRGAPVMGRSPTRPSSCRARQQGPRVLVPNCWGSHLPSALNAAPVGEPPALRDLAHGGGGGGVGAWIWWSSSSFVRALDTSLLALAEEEFEAGAPRVPLGTSG